MPNEPENVNALPADPLVEALAKLEPAPARLDRDRLMFAAGAASRRSTIRLWQATAGFLAAIGFMAGMAMKAASVVYVDREPAPAKVTPMSDEKVPSR